MERIYIYRGLCKNRGCPLTVTHYPVFVMPYKIIRADIIEEVVRERIEGDVTWEEMNGKWGFDIKTMRRWCSSILHRGKDIINALLFYEEKYKPAAAAGLPPVTSETLLKDVFDVADRVGGILTTAGLWRQEVPKLSLVRAGPGTGVCPMPVWVW